MREILGGRYQIIEKIGGGGMAIVYLAKDLFLDRQVAVKVLRDEYVEDPEFIRHFHKEAKSVASLSHPNIVNIYDFDANSHPIYLVMEYIEGKTLKQIVAEEGPLSWDQVADICIQIANGLAEAHRNHIIHKDVKSHNILVDDSGLVKITDFGIAQMMSNTTITHNKGILGSAHYFSPEQARGERVDEKTDIYSLGVVLYEMITGQVPFTGDNPVSVALKHIRETPLKPQSTYSQIPPDMEAVIMKCLEKDKDKRFASMGELSKALELVRGRDSLQSSRYHKNLGVIRSESVSNHPADETLTLPRDLTQKQVLPVDESPNKKSDKTEKHKKQKRRGRFSLFLIIAIIFLVALGTIKATSLLSNRGDIEVPNLIDMELNAAEALVEEADLRLEIEEEIFNDDVEKNHIISQDPESGRNVKSGRVIKVVVSKGSEKVEVPELTGKTVEEAKELLKKADLELGKVSNEYDDHVPSGRIISQSPESGKNVEKNKKVNLTTSLGPQKRMTVVPDVRGMSVDEAKSILQQAAMVLGSVQELTSDSVNKGLITTQSLEPGIEVEEGAALTVTVSKGPDKPPRLDTKNVKVQYVVPSDGLVVIQRSDGNGQQLIHSGQYKAGDNINQTFPYTGSGIIKIFLNDQEVNSIPLEE